MEPKLKCTYDFCVILLMMRSYFATLELCARGYQIQCYLLRNVKGKRCQ